MIADIDEILQAMKKPDTHVSPRELTQNLKLENVNFDESDLKLSNIGNSNFPKNTPCYIVGSKGSGKTYLLASLFQYAFNKKVFKRLFYIYAENVDSTITRAIPKKQLFQIPAANAEQFLIKFLSRKSKFCSCYRFLNSIKDYEIIPKTLNELLESGAYWDNFLNELIRRKRFKDSREMIEYAQKIMTKYGEKMLRMSIDGLDLDLGNFTPYDYDAFIIDDIAQFPELFNINRRKSILYKYFTITRQNMTTFYLAGQELQQLPKLYRSQLGALVVLKGVDVIESLRESKLSNKKVIDIWQKFTVLKQHEGVLINFNNGEIEFIKV